MSGFPINPPGSPLGVIVGNSVRVAPEWYRFFSQVQKRIGSGTDPLGASQFLTLDYNDGLGSERKFTPVSGQLSGTDGGANGPYTLGLADTAVVAGSYGNASNLVTLTIDAKGRITAAANVAVNSDNVTEGVANLFFTQSRARASVSATSPLAYNSGTGVFSVTASALTKTDDTNVTITLGGSPASALLAATSLTLGWTGTLAVSRGGTGGGTASGALLDNITGFSSTGQIVRTGAGSYAFRTLTAPVAGITVSNGSGVSGNPTLALADDLAALEALAGTNTIYYRSGASVWSAVTIGGNLSFSSGTLAVDQTLASGTYTPTLTNSTNVAASTAYACQYMRVGSTVTVSGRVDIDPTSASTSTVLRMSLPIASNFTSGNANECGGVATGNAVAQSMAIIANTTSDEAQFTGIPSSSANASYFFTFTYTIA